MSSFGSLSRRKVWLIMAVKVITRKNWQAIHRKEMDIGLVQMATDVHRLAVQIAPVDKGNLEASGRIKKVKDGAEVIFGGTSGGVSVPYARRRHYENRKNPQTLRYLERAAKAVAKNDSKYFRSQG